MTSSTAHTHRALGDLWVREQAARDAHCRTLDAACAVYGTPRRSYRPVMGVSGTLQSTPNPCMERDRLRFLGPQAGPEDEESAQRRRAAVPGDLLPGLGPGAEVRRRLPDRTAEADLAWGFPPHQVHHHNFGWSLNGAKAEATTFSPRRPWGIGLTYSHDIAATAKQIRDCPASARLPVSPRAQPARTRRGFPSSAGPPFFPGGPGHTNSAGTLAKTSQQASTANLSTAAPSDGHSLADADF